MTKELKENDYIKLTDLNLCVTLCYFGHTIDSINKNNPSKVVFAIKRDENIDELIQKFWAHQLSVEPLRYLNLVKEVKSQIYNN